MWHRSTYNNICIYNGSNNVYTTSFTCLHTLIYVKHTVCFHRDDCHTSSLFDIYTIYNPDGRYSQMKLYLIGLIYLIVYKYNHHLFHHKNNELTKNPKQK